MAPNKDQRKAVRAEFAPASGRRQPARALPRKVLSWRVQDEASESTITAGSHGDESSNESHAPLPPEDRAG